MKQDSSQGAAAFTQNGSGPLVVGVTVELLEPPQYPGKRRVQLFHAYLDCMRRVGLVPLLFPPDASAEESEALLARVDGMLLTGGDDVDLSRDGGPPPPDAGGVIMPPGQQRFGLSLAKTVQERGIPTLGICLGMQFIGMAFGSKLVQHLPQAEDHTKGVLHPIDVREGTRLAQLVGTGTHQVPSFHHQALEEIPESLQVTAHSPDGVVEAFEDPAHPFLVAVQWHPERDADGATTRQLFSGFAAAVQHYREQRLTRQTLSS